MVANTTKGWENLIALGNHTQRVFHYKPVLDFNDLAVFSRQACLDGLSITTGCFFRGGSGSAVCRGHRSAQCADHVGIAV